MSTWFQISVRQPTQLLRHALVLLLIVVTVACDTGPPAVTESASNSATGVAQPVSSGPPWFEEIAADSGLDFTAVSGHTDRLLFPESVFGGGGLFDMDNDGDLDVYLVQGGRVAEPDSDAGRNRLFRNDGEAGFVDVSQGSGADDRAYGMGVASGDFNNDGWTDLYVTNLGANTLLRNNGDGTFSDITAASGTGDTSLGASAAFLDYDADGDLDLFVVNYVNWTIGGELDCYNASGSLDYCLPTNYKAPAGDVLYRNDGDGTFSNVSAEAGLRAAIGNGLGIGAADFDDDGRIDVYVSNDTNPNQLWMSQGDGTFIDDALVRGCALDEHGRAKAGMGVAIGDLDQDSDLDLLVVNIMGESDSFYRNDGGFFADRTAVVGLATGGTNLTRFGVGFADFDNDGTLDLYEANGSVQRSPEPLDQNPYAQPNLLFRGLPGGRFEEVLPRAGVAESMLFTSRAAAFGDVDNDGGMDVLVVNWDSPAQLFHNVVPDRGHWIRFRVLEQHGRDALGATLTLQVGPRTLRRDVRSAYSYCAANDPRVHVGLGTHEIVQAVTVRWPDGTKESFGDFGAAQTVELRQGRGTLLPTRP